MFLDHADAPLARRCSSSHWAAFSFLLLATLSACSHSSSGPTAIAVVAEVLPPRLASAIQNRTLDPQGATIDLVFDEPMDAESVEDVAHYTSSNGAEPRWAALLANGMRLRVSFDAALLPGATTIAVDGVLDLAGNPSAPVAFFPLTSDDTVPPATETTAAISVTGASNDRIEIAFDDDLLPEDAVDPARFQFEHPAGTLIQLDGASIVYVPERRTIVIDFSADSGNDVNLQTGVEWSLALDAIRDLGGNAIEMGTVVSGVVTGDVDAPEVLRVTQNLTADRGGRVVDLAFSEALETDFADALLDWTASSGQNVVDASLLWPGDVVRLSFDAALVPGGDTLALENVFDLAGNQLVAVPVQTIAPADEIAPTIVTVAALAVSGIENDVLTCTFGEPVMASDATNLAHFALFQGAEVDLADSTIAYDAALRTVTITLRESDLAVGSVYALLCDGVRDLAGNPIAEGAGQFGIVSGDQVVPAAITVQQNSIFDPFGRTIDVAFDEPVVLDPAPTFTASGGLVPIATQDLGGSMSVRLVFATPLVPGSSSLQVAGLRDPAGNVASTTTIAISATDAIGPSLTAARAITISGVANDRVTATFGEQVVSSAAVTPARWTLQSPIGTDVPLASAIFVHDSTTSTIAITLPLDVNLSTGASFIVIANGISDVAGNPLGASASISGTVTGDATIPTVVVADRNQTADPASRIVDVTFSEPVTAATAQNALNFDVSGVPNTQSAALLLDGRTVRLYTTAAITPGTTTITISGVRDLASNLMTAAAAVAITL